MRILYICTHNRCRSILSEAISNHFGQEVLVASSAGSQPVGEVHPLTLKYLDEYGIRTNGLASQSWDEQECFKPDVVITVCDSAAKESCPLWFGDCIVLHWGLQDPSKIEGGEEEVKAAFINCIELIKARVEALVEFANAENELTEAALKQLVKQIGE